MVCPPSGADVLNMQDQRRVEGRVIDSHRLQRSEPELYLHRFVRAVRTARQEKGRYLYLRSGDEMAIIAAEDGSTELMEELTVIEALAEDEPGD
jgi:hypothetical protein